MHPLQRRVRRHRLAESTGPAGPEKPGWQTGLTLDFHLTRGHDWSRNLPTRSRLSPLEMLLQDLKPDDPYSADTFDTTDACAGGHDSTTSPNSQGLEPRTQKQRQRYLQEQRHAQHHHHLKEEHFKNKEPRRRGEISETI